jgi:hypothetical protein
MHQTNLHAESLTDMMRQRKAKKPIGQGMAGKHKNTPSYPCKIGRHTDCVKKSCTCDCGHGGIA